MGELHKASYVGELHKVSYPSKKQAQKERMKKNALAYNIQALSLPPVNNADIEAIKERTTMYLDGCAERDIKPGIQGLCLWLGVERATWYAWCRGDNRKETHYDFCNRVMILLAANWENNMQDNKTNAISGIFIGKNDFGYKDKSEVVVEPKQTVVNNTTMSDVMSLIEEAPETKYIEAQFTEITDDNEK